MAAIEGQLNTSDNILVDFSIKETHGRNTKERGQFVMIDDLVDRNGEDVFKSDAVVYILLINRIIKTDFEESSYKNRSNTQNKVNGRKFL